MKAPAFLTIVRILALCATGQSRLHVSLNRGRNVIFEVEVILDVAPDTFSHHHLELSVGCDVLAGAEVAVLGRVGHRYEVTELGINVDDCCRRN